MRQSLLILPVAYAVSYLYRKEAQNHVILSFHLCGKRTGRGLLVSYLKKEGAYE